MNNSSKIQIVKAESNQNPIVWFLVEGKTPKVVIVSNEMIDECFYYLYNDPRSEDYNKASDYVSDKQIQEVLLDLITENKSEWFDPEIEELEEIFKLKYNLQRKVMIYAHKHHHKSVPFSYTLKCAWLYFKILQNKSVTFTKKSGEVTTRSVTTPKRAGYMTKGSKSNTKPDLFMFADMDKKQNGEPFIISFNANQVTNI